MAKEIQFVAPSGSTNYVLLIDNVGRFWNTATSAFEAYNAANYADYDLAATEFGTTGIFSADMPAASSGLYSMVAKTRAGGAPVQGDVVVGAGTLAWNGSVASFPPVTPSDPGMVTGYLTCYDQNGIKEAGVTVTCKVAGFGSDDPSVEITIGYALDSATRTAISDVNGLVQFTNLFKGVIYTFKRGADGPDFSIAIPADAADPYELPSIIGAP